MRSPDISSKVWIKSGAPPQLYAEFIFEYEAGIILSELNDLIHNQYPYIYPCDYDSFEQYMMAMKYEMFEVLYFDWFEGLDKDVIWDIILEFYRDDMIENYNRKCYEKWNTL